MINWSPSCGLVYDPGIGYLVLTPCGTLPSPTVQETHASTVTQRVGIFSILCIQDPTQLEERPSAVRNDGHFLTVGRYYASS